MILDIHKRLSHKPADDLRRILGRAGVPLHALSLVSKALDLCDVCNTWAKVHAKPTMKSHHAIRFNAIVYMDLIFFDRFIVYMAVDEALRFTVLALADYKDTHSLMTIFRREWIKWFGPPKIVRSDKEGAFSGDEFGIEMERLGIQRELVVAGQQHSYLGILDRQVQIVRHFLPRLMQQLSEEAVFCEAEDAISECQFAVNSLMLYRGHSPYECLFGQQPTPLFEEDSDFVSANLDDVAGFYEHHITCSSHTGFSRNPSATTFRKNH